VPDTGVLVVGAGVVGLAVAARLAPSHPDLVLLERNAAPGQETSSRNSEVIHAGIYYPAGSLKGRLCVEGNRLLYDTCTRHRIPHARLGKVVTATEDAELPALDAVRARAEANGVALEPLTAAAVHAREPRVRSVGGLFSPTTGILSAHGLMDHYRAEATGAGATLLTRAEVIAVERRTSDWRVVARTPQGVEETTAECVIDAAGLDSDRIAELAGVDVDARGLRLRWCKGSYFAAGPRLAGLARGLVYPVPSAVSLGVHVVLDLGGRLRFGPDVEYLPGRVADYAVADSKRPAFAAGVRRLFPEVEDADLTPDMSGIRPKLQGPGEPARDFVIEELLPGFIGLIGLESPALTAAPAIARLVEGLLG
jgi:L-2-hydroxyglutarate oxidase LhgO